MFKGSVRTKRILIVEDDEVIRRMLTDVLVFQRYEVRACHNGQEALETLVTESFAPHVILLDLMMPVMDGHQLLNVLDQQYPDTLAKIPVLLLTAVGGAAEALSKRVSGSLKKPVDLAQFLEKIDYFFKFQPGTEVIPMPSR